MTFQASDRAFYDDVHSAAQSSPRKLSRAFLTDYAMGYARSPDASVIETCKTFSMLHQETLALASYFARWSRGAILELGAYIGGATVAMGTARPSSAPGVQITVEVGGAYPNHSDYPTDDILADLKKNIARAGLTHRVNVLEGASDDARIIAAVEKLLDGRKIDVLFIDSDGRVGRDFDIYRRFLDENAVLILDDYLVNVADAADKEVNVRRWVAQAVDAGLVADLGVYHWATWVGQYRG